MPPGADSFLAVWLACCARSGAAPANDPLADTFRSFAVEKPIADPHRAGKHSSSTDRPLVAANARDLLRTSIGVGYVQGADWGVEMRAAGTAFGWDTQFDTLTTFGELGARVDYGALTFQDPGHRWHGEAGDMFSDLRGPVRGLRLTRVGAHWSPGLAMHVDRGAAGEQPRVLLRNRLALGATRFDAEVAADGGQFYRSRLATSSLDIEGSLRLVGARSSARDQAIHAGVGLWRDVWLSASWQRSARRDTANEWRTVGVRVPLGSSVAVTVERTFVTMGAATDVVWASGVYGRMGPAIFYQRYQWGHANQINGGLETSADRRQLQSMAAYAPGPRLNLTLQSATQWAPSVGAQHWLEMEATLRPASRTVIQVASPMPQSFDESRLRIHLEQGLPARLAVTADYGRLSSFQAVQDAFERPRVKVMLTRTVDLATPVRGEVRGEVVDYLNRPVAGARVRLGPYSTEADATGKYLFTRVPAGEFELTLDPDFVPADYAWDGRSRTLTIGRGTSAVIDLHVAPLNAIHGRVYCDRNANGRYDTGEGVGGAVLWLGERATATDSNGAYDFFNLPIGPYVIRLDGQKLAGYDARAAKPLNVELTDARPVTGADFVVQPITKPILWKDSR